MSNKKYGEIDWVGEIPALWEVKRVKDVLSLKGGGVDKKVNEGEKLVKLVNFVDVFKKIPLNNDQNYMVVSCPENKIKDVSLKKNDILITPSSETPKEIGLANIVLEDLNNTVFSYHILRLRSIVKSLNPKYAYYYFNSKLAAFQFEEKAIGTTRVTLSRHDINSNIIFYPSEKEQTAITNYLDQETSKIERKISILEQKYEKLEEYKQSVIFEVVTKGLDSSVQMKNSGIDWIGEIPAHWDIVRLKDFSVIKKGESFDEKLASVDGVYPYINGGINPSDWSNHFNTKENTITVSEGGASAGYTQFMTTKYWAGSHCYKIQSKNKKSDNKYIFYLLKGFEKYLMTEKTGSAMPNLQKTKFINYLVSFVNNIEEQNQIVKYLDHCTSKVDKKIEIIKKQIELLKEYKQSLIYEVVTGKLDIK